MSEIQEMVLPASSHSLDLEHGSLLYIETATMLLRYAGLSILTNPNFLHQGEQAHLGYGLRSTRKTNPAISLEELPWLIWWFSRTCMKITLIAW